MSAYDGISRRALIASAASGFLASVSGCITIGASETPNYVPSKVWEYETLGPVLSVPTMVPGTLFVGSDDGYVYAIEGSNKDIEDAEEFNFPISGYDLDSTNSPDGVTGPRKEATEKWRFETNGPVRAAPVVWEGSLLFGSSDNYFYSVDVESGEENWRFDTGHRIMSGASVNDGVVYLASGLANDHPDDDGGGVFALNTENGEEVWGVDYDVGVLSPPVHSDGIVYHGDQNGSFVARDAGTGEEVWTYDAVGPFCACRAAIDGENAYIGAQDNRMYALDLDSGEKKWEFETERIVVSSPTVAEDTVYFGSRDNNFYAVDAETGRELWRYSTGADIVSSPAYRDGILYVGSMDGVVYALDSDTGDLVWGFETDGMVKSSPLVTEDLIYVGSEDYKVYAIGYEEVSGDDHENHVEKIENRSVSKGELQEERIRRIYEDA